MSGQQSKGGEKMKRWPNSSIYKRMNVVEEKMMVSLGLSLSRNEISSYPVQERRYTIKTSDSGIRYAVRRLRNNV